MNFGHDHSRRFHVFLTLFLRISKDSCKRVSLLNYSALKYMQISNVRHQGGNHYVRIIYLFKYMHTYSMDIDFFLTKIYCKVCLCFQYKSQSKLKFEKSKFNCQTYFVPKYYIIFLDISSVPDVKRSTVLPYNFPKGQKPINIYE